jgi:Tfp pilus assembly pilus retraction ATPase PilT
MPWWTDVFHAALAPGVEEVTLAVGRPPQLRQWGHLLALGEEPLSAEQTRRLFEAIAPPLVWRRLMALGRAEFVYALSATVGFTVHCFQFRGRVGMILRRSPHPLPQRGIDEE